MKAGEMPMFIIVAPCPVCGDEVDLSCPEDHLLTHAVDELIAAGINVVIG